MEVLALGIASVLFAAGIIGLFVPVLPESPLILAGMIVYGLIAGFEELGLFFFIAQSCLALAVMGVDYLATALGSRWFGASRLAAIGAILGLIAGFFFFPIGVIVGPFLGAVLLELAISRKVETALLSGLGAVIGFWGGVAGKLVLEAAMITWFFIRVF